MKVKLEKLVPGGQALGQLSDGKKVFVWGGLPGEEVEIAITKSKKSYAEGVVEQVLIPSPQRVEPRDACYLSTSPWQIMDYQYELEQKSQLVQAAFESSLLSLRAQRSNPVEKLHGKIPKQFSEVSDSVERFKPGDIPIPGSSKLDSGGDPVTRLTPSTFVRGRQPRKMFGDFINSAKRLTETDGKQYEYRNKMEYSLYWDNDENLIKLAFHQRGTHRKLPVEGSSIERPEIWAEAKRVVDELNARKAQARTYQSLMIRCDQAGRVSSGLFENHKPHPKMSPLTDTILGREYTYSLNGFFQINLPVYELALRKIQQFVLADLPIVDMYAGVGTIGLSVAALGQPLTLVETNPDAFAELEINAQKAADNPNIDAILAKSENALEYITYDINLIVDPPRAGLDEAVVERILAVRPRRVIYLSCNPVTQARDIAKLTEKYSILDCTGYNFFPRTPHIENLIVLERL
jgi:23S rRNA (uracil1939-C5)-methyltransferase